MFDQHLLFLLRLLLQAAGMELQPAQLVPSISQSFTSICLMEPEDQGQQSLRFRELKHRKKPFRVKTSQVSSHLPKNMCWRVYFMEQAVASSAAAAPECSAHHGLLHPKSLGAFPKTERPLKVGREGTNFPCGVCRPLSPAGLRDTPDSTEPLLSAGLLSGDLTHPWNLLLHLNLGKQYP